MPRATLNESDKLGYKEKLARQLEAVLDTRPVADIIEFIEAEEYLGQKLFPRQKLILKIYYKLDLTDEELADAKYLLSAENQYARMYFPGLCAHHVIGTCEREVCTAPTRRKDYRILSDAEIKERLKAHEAFRLVWNGGRREGKTLVVGGVGAYELYKLARIPNPQKAWGISSVTRIGFATVAPTEKQAKELYDNLALFIQNSPWFRRLSPRILETELELPGRGLYAIAFHSNSTGVRGKAFIGFGGDEFAHMNVNGGKLSDEAMKQAIEPATAQFGAHAKAIWISSPLNKAGEFYKWHEACEKGEGEAARFTIVFQLATWEVNPLIPRSNPLIVEAYGADRAKAEVEYGAQFAEQGGNFLKREAVERCSLAGASQSIQLFGEGHSYVCHIDPAKNRDTAVLGVGYFDKVARKVRLVHIKAFDDKEVDINESGEVDLQRIEDYIVDLQAKGFWFSSVTFDQFNSLALIQRLQARGIPAAELNANEKTNMQLYGNLKSLIDGNGIEWYPVPELDRQLTGLTRTMKGRDKFKVEAPVGYHDDYADVAAAVAYKAIELEFGSVGGVAVGKIEKKGEAPARPECHPKCKPGKYHVPECPVILARDAELLAAHR